jgi:hypothetical protein
MHGVGAHSSWTTLLPGMIAAGAGVGTANPTLAEVAVGVVSPARSGMASGINNTCRQVGIATGIAALGAIFQHEVQTKALQLLAATPAAGALKEGNVQQQLSSGNGGALRGLPPELRLKVAEAGKQAFASGLNEILIVGGIVAAVGALAGLTLIRRRDMAEGAVQAGATAGV